MNEVTAKRLAVIRHLFEKGKALSYEGEPLNGLRLLPFHDSIEMFMKLCADEKNVPVTRSTMFADYFNLLPDMHGKAQMISLNARRVSLKHHGQMPSSLDVELSRANVIDFFEHNTPVFFGCKLEEVLLEVLISYPEVRDYLSSYHGFMNEGKYGEAQAQCQIAMKALLSAFLNQNERGHSLEHNGWPASNAKWLSSPHLEDKTDKYLEDLREDVMNLNEAIYIMNLGINYFKYGEFIDFGPTVNQWPGEKQGEYQYDYYLGSESQYSEETAKACYDFVIETAFRLMGSKVFLY